MIKRLVTYIGILVLLVVIGALAVPMFLGKQAEQLFITKVSSQFTTRFIIKDKIELSLWRNFPYASLTLHAVELRESLPNSQRNVLEAQKMSFLFGWLDLFKGNYKVERVNIENGALNLRILLNGETNYQVFAPNPPNQQPNTQAVTIELKQVNLYNINVLYLDELYKQETQFAIQNGIMAANFGAVKYNLQLQADLAVKHFYLYNTNYLPNKQAKLNLNTGIDFDKNLYTFANSSLQIENSRFDLSGRLQFLNQSSDIDLALKGINLQLTDILPLLPAAYYEPLKNTQSKGAFEFETTIKGTYNNVMQPAVNATFNLANGSLTLPNANAPMQNLQLSGAFTNGSLQELSTAELTLHNLSFALKGQPFTAQGKITNFNNPLANLTLNGSIDLSVFEKTAAQYGYPQAQGTLSFEQVQFNGNIEQAYSATALIYPTISGKVGLNNLSFKQNGKPANNLSAQVELNGQHCQLQALQWSAGSSKLNASGSLLNLTPLLFQALGKDTITVSQPVNVNLNLTAPNIDIAQVMQYLQPDSNAAPKNTPPPQTVVNKQQYAIGNCTLKIDTLTQNKFTYTQVQGNITFDANEYIIQQLTLKLLGGSADIRGNVQITDQQNLTATAFVSCNQLNMQQLLENADNFGQTSLTDKNLKGSLSGNFYFVAPFNRQFKLNEQAFKLVADLQLDNGELIDFEPMMALSSFVKVSELKRIKFARLQNQIEIRNRKMYIPAMFIGSNVANFTLSGSHTFDNRLQYYLKLNLMDILTGKFKKQNQNITTDPNPKGGINLYLTLTGTPDKPTIQYLKKRKVKQQFDRDAHKTKTDLQKILEQAFNPNRTTLADTLDLDFMNWTE